VVNETDAARQFCDRHGALLFEDAVHVLRPVGAIGTAGDFVAYSPRKYFDIPDGGILAVRGAELAALVHRIALDLPPARPSTLAWTLGSLRPKRRPLTGPLRPMAIDDAFPQPRPLPAIWMSALSRSRLRNLLRN